MTDKISYSLIAMPNQIAASPEDGLWESLPDHILLEVFYFLKAGALLQAAQVCSQWRRVAHDEFLWKELLCQRWNIDRCSHLAPSRKLWFAEYKRLHYHTPCHETEVLTKHRDQVLHVSFSHNGRYFATSSKDGFVKVWSMTHPCSLVYSEDMRKFTWKYTQFTQFNKTDKLLLVSGVHFGSHSTSGEIVIFNMEENFKIECRVQNKPYDIFGTWYNETHLLSGNLHWLGNFTSCSVLWLNKAYQALESEWESVVMRLFKFQNINASSIRTILVAECLDSGQSTVGTGKKDGEESQEVSLQGEGSHGALGGSVCTMQDTGTFVQEAVQEAEVRDREDCTDDVMCGLHSTSSKGGTGNGEDKDADDKKSDFSAKEGQSGFLLDIQTHKNGSAGCDFKVYDTGNGQPGDLYSIDKSDGVVCDGHKVILQGGSGVHVGELASHFDMQGSISHSSEQAVAGCSSSSSESSHSGEAAQTLKEPDKYLIFTTGSLTYTPHQIGIKRMSHEDTIGKMHRLTLEREKYQSQLSSRRKGSVENSEDNAESHSNGHVLMDIEHQFPSQVQEEDAMRMDSVDHVIEMGGHIIGFCLSADNRYLYVNTRAWPQNYQITDALDPPPIAQEIEIHVIDLLTITDLGVMHSAHKAFTPNDECFFIFLDVCKEYVASGAEDKHAYLWDRHYRSLLHSFSHDDVVNSVAFHPQDAEVLVTVSDDNKIKVWRSRNRCQELGIEVKSARKEVEVKEEGEIEEEK